ncbi:MAG: hypothetical protein ACT4OM_06855 [Actinomycetota bacterium]
MRASKALVTLIILGVSLSLLLVFSGSSRRGQDPEPPKAPPGEQPSVSVPIEASFSPPSPPSPAPAPEASATDPATPGPAESAAPAASPGPLPRPPAPTPGVAGLTVWSGPDEAVATFRSQRCGREVLRFGAQQYTTGLTGLTATAEIAFLGYSSGPRQLWGDRGAPATLYITTDGGQTFTEWLAVSENC